MGDFAEFLGAYLLPRAGILAPVGFIALFAAVLLEGQPGWRSRVAKLMSGVGILCIAYIYWLTADWVCAHWVKGTSFRPVLQELAGNPAPLFLLNLTPLCHWGWRGELLLFLLSVLLARDFWKTILPKEGGDGYPPREINWKVESPTKTKDSDTPASKS